eukprot:g14884.t1
MRVLSIRVNDEQVLIDPRSLTFAERKMVKREAAKIDDADEMDTMALTVWVVLRRDDPELTPDEVFESLTFGDMVDADVASPEIDDPEQSGPG